MPIEVGQARLAVLIDADNTSARLVKELLEEIARIGDASVKWVYGDFADQHSKGWSEVLAEHALTPKQQFAYVKGKNASDISLVIDAMDLLHTGRFDGFCLVSSDSDFTRLALRIREQGVRVYGLGTRKTPESFRRACTRFIFTENLTQLAGGTTPASPASALASARDTLIRVLRNMETEDGWVRLSQIGQQLTNTEPDFDPRTFGVSKLSDLVRSIGELELGEANGHLRVREIQLAQPPRAKQARRRAS